MNEREPLKTQSNNLPACAAEYIRGVVKKMRYRRKVRRDVQAELSAHFEDELKNCATDEDKEQKAQRLIAEFGDVKLLAVLMRRAKKRCRPFWRTVLARTFQTAGVLIVCFILYTVWFCTGEPAITTDYLAELNRIVRPVADESLNAAPYYNRAAELCEEIPDEIYEILLKRRNEVTPQQKQRIRNWLAANEEILGSVITGTEKPYYWQQYHNKQDTFTLFAAHRPVFGRLRGPAHALCWRARIRAEQGRFEDAFRDMKACYWFGRHLRGDNTLIEQLRGIGIETLAVDGIREILGEYRIDSTTLDKVQNDFEKMVVNGDFLISIETQKPIIHDMIQRSFIANRLGSEHFFPYRTMGLLDQRVREWEDIVSEVILCPEAWNRIVEVLFFHPGKDETRRTADRYFAFWEKMVDKTPAQIQAEGIDVEKEAMDIINGNVWLTKIAPHLEMEIEVSHQSKADIEAVVTIMGILRYKQDLGRFPQSLDELIEASYLTRMPLDPYSNRPLIYRRTDGDFTLYSLGRDFSDDGGEVARDGKGRVSRWAGAGDAVFWPRFESQKKPSKGD